MGSHTESPGGGESPDASMPWSHLTPYKCLQVLYVFLRLPGALAFFLVMNLMRVLAPDFTFRMFKEKIDSSGTMGFAEKIKSLDDMEFLFSFASVKKKFSNAMGNVLKEAQRGCPAPNPELYDLNTRKVVSLLSRSRPGRPLVVNFGSCS